MRRKIHISEDFLRQEYLEKRKTYEQISQENNWCISSIQRFIKLYNIKPRGTGDLRFCDLTGQRFGRLTVISYVQKSPENCHNAYWICQCDCGNISYPQAYSLKSGVSQSCGCLQLEKTYKGYRDISGAYWFNIQYAAEIR